jgi:catechol 2,3-dioxygenase-like lactoylglutathione lyase family enzyme
MPKHISTTQLPGPSALDPAIIREVRVRRADNKLRNIHHHAYRCRDAEETRHFYEDILKMPLVAAVVMPADPAAHMPTFCHIFFEMGDGNCIAFFDCPEVLKDRTFKPEGPLDHHLAIEVEGDEVIDEFRGRLTDAGVELKFIDHGVYHSLYFNDPNGLNCEIVSKVRATYDNDIMEVRTAHDNLKNWSVGKHGKASGEQEKRPARA